MSEETQRAARRSKRRLRCGALLALPLLFGSASALATDPGIALRLHSAPVRSPVTGERLDVNGTNQTSVLLPSQPSLTWQTRLAPPLVGELAVDERGRLLVAHAGDRLSALDAHGHSVWSLRVGTDLVSGPLPLAGGRCLAVTRDSEVVRVSPNGASEGREPLAWGELEAPVLATSTRDGGAIIAAGARLSRLGPRGTRGWDARLPDPVRAVFEWRAQTLAVGRSGMVFAHATVGGASVLGSFEEPLRAVALAGDRLLGLGRRALLEFDLGSKQRRVLFGDDLGELRDIAALGAGKWRLIAARATVVDLDANGRELSRLPFSLSEGGGELAAIVADRAGRSLLGAAGSALTLVNPQGDSTTLADSSCPDPMRPTPLADGTFVVSCRSGLLRALSDRAR